MARFNRSDKIKGHNWIAENIIINAMCTSHFSFSVHWLPLNWFRCISYLLGIEHSFLRWGALNKNNSNPFLSWTIFRGMLSKANFSQWRFELRNSFICFSWTLEMIGGCYFFSGHKNKWLFCNVFSACRMLVCVFSTHFKWLMRFQ